MSDRAETALGLIIDALALFTITFIFANAIF